MAQFDYKGFLKEGGIEKYLIEENFGNDIESRYNFIRPLMSRLPDSARTEMLIDGMEEARTEDDKAAFDFYFVEAMKELGLEDELMEADSLINPEAEEIEATDLDAAADYFDSLAENDDVLDEMLDEGELEEIEGEVQTENKLLKASNTLEDALNKVADDLTDEQIDKFTEMILDLRDKVKAEKK